MNRLILNFIIVSLIICTNIVAQKNVPVYLNPKASVEERVNDLLSRMTIEEKIGQMNQFVGIEHIKAAETSLTEEQLKNNTANAFYPGFSIADLENLTKNGLVGSFLHVLTIEEANYLQSLAMQSRLKIPIIFGIDAIHGNANAPDNTVYPTNIGLASSFDTDMAYKIARQTAEEMRAMNMHWTFNPNVEVARDPRWGRVGETFGEDPYLVSQMGIQTVKGYQGELNGKNDVLACIKHFVAGSESVNGTNGAPADFSERTLREVFFPPFKSGVDAGAMSLMMSHNELNGIPCHSNQWLMTDVLRKEWGFKGFIVSDWMDIEHLYDLHATTGDVYSKFIRQDRRKNKQPKTKKQTFVSQAKRTKQANPKTRKKNSRNRGRNHKNGRRSFFNRIRTDYSGRSIQCFFTPIVYRFEKQNHHFNEHLGKTNVGDGKAAK
jgi:beta-glucosidase